MSLKTFHIVFMICSIALSVLSAGWGVLSYVQTRNLNHLLIGLLFFLTVGVLVFYLLGFSQRYRDHVR